jgi:hypothetical protein
MKANPPLDLKAGEHDLHDTFRRIGADGNKIGAIWIDGTDPLLNTRGAYLDVGANWESGGHNERKESSGGASI